jgi:uncharacterized protein YgbK (DUF1537 family)
VSLRLAFYGDDFTGSSDALEVLAFAGLRCAMFVEPPTADALERLGGFDAIGVAGDSRGMSPVEMDAELPAIFEALAALHVPILHYKVCSTFDSGPRVGSIGRVIAIARERLRAPTVPIVAGTPALGRYCLFGHLFARSATDGRVYRIDRHPIMSRHPVTPMGESELAKHFALQSPLAIANLPFTDLDHGPALVDERMRALVAANPDAIVLDTATPAHLTEVGRLLDESSRGRQLFVVGSSGAEYALTQWWRERDGGRESTANFETFARVDRVLAISGSASRLSEQQIDFAVAAGFVEVPLDATALVGSDWERAAAAAVSQAAATLGRGRSVVLHTARGPDDPRIEAMLHSLQASGATRDDARIDGGRLLGTRLGEIVRRVMQGTPVQRLLLSGGDTSSQITKLLAPDAIVVAARLAPGAPLCRFVSRERWLDGVEVALKGGQMGGPGFFEDARRGRS